MNLCVENRHNPNGHGRLIDSHYSEMSNNKDYCANKMLTVVAKLQQQYSYSSYSC